MYADDVEFFKPMIGTRTTGLAAMRTQAGAVTPLEADLEQTGTAADRFV